MPNYSLYIKTEEIAVLKSTIEILKDVIQETIICATYNKENNEKNNSNNDGNDDIDDKNKSKSKSKSKLNENTPKKRDKTERKIKETDTSQEKKPSSKTSKKKDIETTQKSENTDTETNKKPKKIKNALKIFKLDKNKILLVSLQLTNFSEFFASKSQTKIGIEMAMLAKPFKSMEKEGVLTISMNKGDNRHLNLTLEKKEGTSLDTYQVNTLDLDEKSHKIPELKFDIIITMKCAEFHKICKSMQNMDCEHIEIKCNKKVAVFSSLGDGITVCKEYTASDDTEDGGVHIKCTQKNKNDVVAVKNVYELRNFILFGKCKDICHDVRLYLKKNYPVFLKYTVGSLGTMLVGVSPICEKNLHENMDEDDSYDPADTTYYKRTEIKALEE